MIKRINYTGRRRLTREQASITLAVGEEQPNFTLDLNLGRARFPNDAEVIVEAHRQTSFMRWQFGTVGQPVIPSEAERRLSDFGSGTGVRFRVKVVEARADVSQGQPARVLAHAEGLRPRAPSDEDDRAESLLCVDWGEDDAFRHLPWRLEFDESSDPLLRISRHLVPDKDAFVAHPAFVCLVLPEILRSVLTRILVIDQDRGDDDIANWHALWLKFAAGLPGIGAPPLEITDSEDWIDAVISTFCMRARIREKLGQWTGEES